jgi:hypothetical protein
MNPHCCTYVGSTEPGDNAGVIDVYACTFKARPHLNIRYADEGSEYSFGEVENYRKSVKKDPEDTIQWGRALEIYDAYFAAKK